MQEKEFETANGSLYYTCQGTGVVITRYNGLESEVTVPERLDDLPVTEVEKKVFLSKKRLVKVVLPGTIQRIGDWAFAYCDNLKEVWMPAKEISIGKAIFTGDSALQRICLGANDVVDGDAKEKDCAELLAAAVAGFSAYYLLDPKEAGSKEWLTKWDAKLADILKTPETDGYSKQVLCGEEDYGSTDVQAYMSMRRRERVRLCYLRLLHPKGIGEDFKLVLEEYLRQHTKGCSGEETWQVLRTEHGNDREYYEMFVRLKCLTSENTEGILADIGGDYPEMKAFFLNCRQESGQEDFFAGLEL